MIFKNREDAGRQLARRLSAYANRNDVTVLGIPRGGVRVAFEIAHLLKVPLDICLSRKLGVPGQEELAFGAIAAGDGRYLDKEVIEAAGVSREQIERITQEVKETLSRRAVLYRGKRPPLHVAGETVILIDDGIATGASIYAAIHALRQMKPAQLIIAVPVAPAETCSWLRAEVDELVCLCEPHRFYAVGQFYERFSQVSDEEVIELLRRAEQSTAHPTSVIDSESDKGQREISINVRGMLLRGDLSIPRDPKGIVLFAHGSGSSRLSPRNRYVAKILQSQGIATLLFDLLTHAEEFLDQGTAELRFDIPLLASRLVAVTKWVTENASTRNLRIGYFGASTGAAAALVAAAYCPHLVAAVVSRGGRPDLAADALERVRASVLLIVGGKDETVLTLNRQAAKRLHCPTHQLMIVPGATHLFEEPGTLERVAQAAANWFARYLVLEGWNKETGVIRASGAL